MALFYMLPGAWLAIFLHLFEPAKQAWHGFCLESSQQAVGIKKGGRLCLQPIRLDDRLIILNKSEIIRILAER